ncbi:MAG: LEPR-XLL domain-containing protein, partial [Pirellulales bacterium]|nr:LEPR-XLL domain-containing protein [Pirellulales bacterium]
MRRSYERILSAIHQAHLALGRRATASRGSSRRRQAEAAGALRFEHLEPRVVMSASGLVPVGAQPEGPLTGKIVYTSGGHGWQWSTTLGRYATDRGDNNEIIEDFGNQEQMTYYADYLLRAGATVVPMRPVGRQLNEVVLDNDSAGVTFTGSWTNSTGSVYYDEDYGVGGGGNADAVSYRVASINATETATATYTPNIPQEGFYPVYTWVADGANRTNQLYRVNHSGGATELHVDHRLVGKGWVYLGTYHFTAGSSGNVEISNHSTAGGSVVIADSIRFGNGMGDVVSGNAGIGQPGGVVSGYPREDENSLHWLWRAVGQGNSASAVTGGGNVSAPSRMAEHMNAAPFGQSVYIGFHSNAGGGRGAVGLIDSDQFTPNQSSLATYTGRQINQDMQALNGQFEHNWSTRTTHTFSGGFGEIDEGASAEMDMTIIETAFHDSAEDAQLMRDPKVREQLGRSTYEATLEYFDNFGGLTAPVTQASAPINVRAVSAASGEVTVSWSAGPTGVFGQVATGFMIYASTNGYGFDGGTLVAGGGTTTATLSGYDPALPYYFKVVAVNAGGESKASEVMAVVANGGVQRVLIVNGFDRFERTQNFRYPYAHTGDGLVDRVWSRYNNSFDYAVQMASAIHASAPNVAVSTTSNEAVISGAVNLANYDAVMWILGEESTANDTFNATEQTKVAAYMAQGGKLFVSGSEIGFDLDAQGGGAAFFNDTLKADYVADDAFTYNVAAAAGSIFTGLSFSFSSGAQFSNLSSQTYNVDTPDRINPLGGATAALNYNTGTGAAGIQ